MPVICVAASVSAEHGPGSVNTAIRPAAVSAAYTVCSTESTASPAPPGEIARAERVGRGAFSEAFTPGSPAIGADRAIRLDHVDGAIEGKVFQRSSTVVDVEFFTGRVEREAGGVIGKLVEAEVTELDAARRPQLHRVSFRVCFVDIPF